MLIQFSVTNFGSFKESQTFSFVASSYDDAPEWVIERDVPSLSGIRYLTAAGVFGANASGKSMLIDAIATMRRMVRESATLMPDDPLPYDPFRLDAQSACSDTSFEVVFESNGIRYDYSLSYCEEMVTFEELRRFETKSPQLLFRLKRDADGGVALLTTKRMTKLQKQEEYLRSKPNSLLLSRAAQEGVEEVVAPYMWLSSGLIVYSAPFDRADPSIYGPLIDGSKGSEMRDRLVSLAKRADLGITDIRAEDVPPTPEEYLTRFYAPEVVKKLAEVKRERARFVHSGDDGEVEFFESDESVGTRAFLSAAAASLEALAEGKTLLFDEIDNSLHPKLSEALVELFADRGWNQTGAQLLFTAHTATLMDSLRRDQIWITQKDARGSSHLEALSDYRLRKDERKSRGYIAGRYGGVPVVELASGVM